MWLKFSDGTFAVFVIDDITEGFGYKQEEININTYSKDYIDRPLVELGIITENEWEKAIIEENIKTQKYHEECVLKEEKRIKEYELEQLKILQDKYLNK